MAQLCQLSYDFAPSSHVTVQLSMAFLDGQHARVKVADKLKLFANKSSISCWQVKVAGT